MKKVLGLVAGLALVAGSALASNTGFKLNFPLVQGPTSTNWVSVPFFFYPNGNVGTSQTAQDLCVDLNGPTTPNPPNVLRLVKWNPASDTPTTKGCNNTLASFTITAGEAYAFIPAGPGITVPIVGSHDDAYADNKGGVSAVPLVVGPTSTNWISVPYHTTANTAQDLCVEFNGPTTPNPPNVLRIVKWNAASDTPTTKGCNNTLTSFSVTPGDGYAFVPNGPGKSLAFDVY
jgi:hypothetical protein